VAEADSRNTQSGPRPLRWISGLARIYKVLLVVGALGGVVLTFAGVKDLLTSEPPPVSKQLEAIRHDAAKRSLRPFVSRKADLHGTGTSSYLFLLTDLRREDVGGADQIVIYDEVDGRLRQRFSFRPEPGHGFDGGIHIHLKALHDFDKDGRPELIGSLTNGTWQAGSPVDEAGAGVPFLIAWDDSSERYRIGALTTTLPRLGRFGTRPRKAEVKRTDTRLTYRDATNGQVVAGYPAEDFVLVNTQFNTVLIAAFYSRLLSGSALRAQMEVRPWIINLGARPPYKLGGCFSDDPADDDFVRQEAGQYPFFTPVVNNATDLQRVLRRLSFSMKRDMCAYL
jgi:hypothetical protein